MPPSESEKSYLPYIALIAVQVCFGTGPVIGKIVLKVIPAIGVVGFRVGITTFVLVIIQILRKRFWIDNRADYWRLAILSLFGVTLNQLFFVGGLSLTKASNAALLAVTIPVFSIVIGSIAGVERLRVTKLVGILLAAAGVILIVDPRNASFSSETTRGDLLIIANSFCYGVYVATSKTVVTRNGAFRSTMWLFVFAALFCIPLGIYSMSFVDIPAVEPRIWLFVAYMALVVTLAPYFLTSWALSRVNPSVVAVFIYLYPMIGFLLAVIFLGEHIDLRFILATFLIFAGVYLVTRRKFVPIET